MDVEARIQVPTGRLVQSFGVIVANFDKNMALFKFFSWHGRVVCDCV